MDSASNRAARQQQLHTARSSTWVGAGNRWPGGPVAPVTGRPPGLRTLPHGLLKTKSDRIIASPVHVRAGAALNLPDLLDLVRTVVIEAAFIAVVVAIDIA